MKLDPFLHQLRRTYISTTVLSFICKSDLPSPPPPDDYLVHEDLSYLSLVRKDLLTGRRPDLLPFVKVTSQERQDKRTVSRWFTYGTTTVVMSRQNSSHICRRGEGEQIECAGVTPRGTWRLESRHLDRRSSIGSGNEETKSKRPWRGVDW